MSVASRPWRCLARPVRAVADFLHFFPKGLLYVVSEASWRPGALLRSHFVQLHDFGEAVSTDSKPGNSAAAQPESAQHVITVQMQSQLVLIISFLEHHIL